MKALIMVLSLGFAVFSNASESLIVNSDLDVEKQKTVIAAVENACGYMLRYEQSAPTVVRIDFQELGDVFYTISLSTMQRFDQFLDQYDVTVEAVVPAVPSQQDFFEVTNVQCVMR